MIFKLKRLYWKLQAKFWLRFGPRILIGKNEECKTLAEAYDKVGKRKHVHIFLLNDEA